MTVLLQLMLITSIQAFTGTSDERLWEFVAYILRLIQERNGNRPDPNKGTHTQTTGHTKTSQTKPVEERRDVLFIDSLEVLLSSKFLCEVFLVLIPSNKGFSITFLDNVACV